MWLCSTVPLLMILLTMSSGEHLHEEPDQISYVDTTDSAWKTYNLLSLGSSYDLPLALDVLILFAGRWGWDPWILGPSGFG